MSIKKDLKIIQEEFKNDEKIFASVFQLERFISKYKVVIVGAIVVLIVALIAWRVQVFIKEKDAQAASKIYYELLQKPDPNDAKLLEELKNKAPDLADLFSLSLAMTRGSEDQLKSLMGSKNPLVKEIATYQLASLTKDMSLLANISSSFESLAKFQQAFLLLEDKKIKEAEEVLQSVPQGSAMQELIKLLSHYKGL